jgi:hypothetical protein
MDSNAEISKEWTAMQREAKNGQQCRDKQRMDSNAEISKDCTTMLR